jgi:hypothetical protein
VVTAVEWCRWEKPPDSRGYEGGCVEVQRSEPREGSAPKCLTAEDRKDRPSQTNTADIGIEWEWEWESGWEWE